MEQIIETSFLDLGKTQSFLLTNISKSSTVLAFTFKSFGLLNLYDTITGITQK